MSAASPDVRVEAVEAVLGGRATAEVADEHDVPVDLVCRWVSMYRAAGTAAVRNEPEEHEAWTRDRVLAAISQELRAPLAEVRASLGRLGVTRDPSQPPPSPLHLQLHASFEQLDASLHRLLETTKASYGRTELDRRQVRLSELLADTDAVVTEDGVVDVDPDRMLLVLEDLLALADRGPETTQVRVRAGMDGAWAELVVERDGAPWDPDRLEAELDPFAPRDDHQDITFGLHLAMALTVRHGGHLGVRRRGDTDELWVRIPAHRAPS